VRILYLTQYFPPEIGAPQTRIPELMRQMIERGHEVTILTAMPNYPEGRVFSAYRGRILAVEQFESMRVVRTWIYPTLSVGFIRRTLNQISFALSTALLGPWVVGRQDVILAGSPPLFIAGTARLLGLVLRCPYIAVVADLWPEILIEMGLLKGRAGIGVTRALERMLYTNALAVLTQTPGQARNVRERFPGIKTEVLSGGVDAARFGPHLRAEAIRREFGVDGACGVAFVGLHGFAQGLDVVLEAAAILACRPDLRFVLIGGGAEKERLVLRAEAMGLRNVAFFDTVPRDRVPAILASMDIAVVTLRRGVPRATLPSKIYEAMASGLPLAVSADGELFDLVCEERIGAGAPSGDARGLAAAIESLASDAEGRAACGRRGQELVHARYDRPAIAARLHELLGSWLKAGS
jgi:glycosyltransferase involved in cell wall biosynthesis